MRNFLFFSIFATLISCGEPQPSSQLKKDIDGNEGLQSKPVKSELVKRAVGRLLINGSEKCHAFATGEYEVTTAGHCVSEVDENSQVEFVNALDQRFVLTVAEVNTSSDVATLESQSLLPGFLTKSQNYRSNPLYSVQLITFASDNVYSHRDSPLFEEKSRPGIIFHQYDTGFGDSGAPLLDHNNRVIGMHVGAEFNENYNVIIDVNHFSDDSLNIQEWFVLEGKVLQCVAKKCAPLDPGSTEKRQCIFDCMKKIKDRDKLDETK